MKLSLMISFSLGDIEVPLKLLEPKNDSLWVSKKQSDSHPCSFNGRNIKLSAFDFGIEN